MTSIPELLLGLTPAGPSAFPPPVQMPSKSGRGPPRNFIKCRTPGPTLIFQQKSAFLKDATRGFWCSDDQAVPRSLVSMCEHMSSSLYAGLLVAFCEHLGTLVLTVHIFLFQPRRLSLPHPCPWPSSLQLGQTAIGVEKANRKKSTTHGIRPRYPVKMRRGK